MQNTDLSVINRLHDEICRVGSKFIDVYRNKLYVNLVHTQVDLGFIPKCVIRFEISGIMH